MVESEDVVHFWPRRVIISLLSSVSIIFLVVFASLVEISTFSELSMNKKLAMNPGNIPLKFRPDRSVNKHFISPINAHLKYRPSLTGVEVVEVFKFKYKFKFKFESRSRKSRVLNSSM